jgi:hypothetical protein
MDVLALHKRNQVDTNRGGASESESRQEPAKRIGG